MTYKLQVIPAAFVGRAWLDGAHMLAKACETSGGEITGDQLKLMLSRGERDLIRMDMDGQAVGWGVVRVDQLPNVRALHICEMFAPGGHWPGFFKQLCDMARASGCSEVRCSAGPAQARLYQRHHAWQPLYTTMRIEL